MSSKRANDLRKTPALTAKLQRVRTIIGRQQDEELGRLGERLDGCIISGQWSLAEIYLRGIKERAKILMKQLEES